MSGKLVFEYRDRNGVTRVEQTVPNVILGIFEPGRDALKRAAIAAATSLVDIAKPAPDPTDAPVPQGDTAPPIQYTGDLVTNIVREKR